MQRLWCSRLFFAAVGALAVGAIVSGSACTRWGQPGPITPTLAPLSSINVNPSTGSDSTGNGSSSKPYRTLTKAVTVLTSVKSFATGGVTIFLASGDYNSANGEKFPIVVPTNVSIMGTSFGTGPRNGSFIDGIGQDTILEGAIHAPSQTFYTTLEIVPPANVNVSALYVGAVRLSLPSSRAGYSAIDILGTLNATDAAFASGVVSRLKNIGGALVAGGSLNCGSCQIAGRDFGVGAFAISIPSPSPPPSSSPSPSSTPPPTGIPSITLMHSMGDSTITASVADIITDGNVNVSAQDQSFELGQFAFSDALRPIVSVPARGAIDFGGGGTSTGGNSFIGARVTEIAVSRPSEVISALDDTWNPNQQKANRSGLYMRSIIFGSGTAGKNVTIAHNAVGSTVAVGPAPVPTPTPTGPPSPTPTASPT